MRMAITTLTSKGQTTIPKAIRERAGLEAGETFTVYLDDQNCIVLALRSVSFREMEGLLYDPDREPVSVEAMDEAIGEATRLP